MTTVKIPFEVNNANLRDRFFLEIIPESFDKLEEDAEPLWGSMTAQHMVEHLDYAFEIATDKVNVECNVPEEKIPKLQAFLSMNRPMPKGYTNPVTGDELADLRYQNLEQAGEKLKAEIQYFLSYYKTNPDATHVNPTFGELNVEQWHKFQFKHCFHHLSQFNLIALPNVTDEK